MFYLASIYIFILNYICMHVLRHYRSKKKKMCKAYKCINNKVKCLNGFRNVF